MALRIRSWRVWLPALVLMLGLTTLASAQLGGGGSPGPRVQEFTQQETACKGEGDAGNGGDGSSPADTLYQREVRLHSGDKEEHQHAQLGHRLQHLARG